MSDPIVDRRDPRQYPCSDHERRLSLTEQAVASIKQTSEGITTKLDLILAQITKVAILEEKHNSQNIDISRNRDDLKSLENKHDALSLEIREFINRTKGMTQVIWAIGGVVGALLVKVLFFAAHNGMTP